MGKKYRNLYLLITSEESLQAAYIKAASGKKNSHGYLVFKEQGQSRLAGIISQLQDETWTSSPYRHFTIYEPKKRLIGAPPFSDRIVHHALVSVIEPIFDRTFLPYSFACRTGKGTHAGVNFIQAELRKHHYKYFLKTDFKGFFPNIDRAILYQEFEKKISCKQTLGLIRKILPPNGTGVPIGALTSQLSANIYGNILDHYLHHELKVKFARYMDDVVVLSDDVAYLREVKILIEEFSATRMKMTISRWQIAPTSRGINFLGYRIWATHKLLRKSSVTRAKKKIKVYTANQEWDVLDRFIGSWKGHATKADSANLRRYLNREYQVVFNLTRFRRLPKPSRKAMLHNLTKT